MHRYADHPALAVWETTATRDPLRRARQPDRDPHELDAQEANRLLEALAAARVPELVLAGDPARRPDLVELVARGRSLGLDMSVLLAATPAATPGLVGALAGAGLSRLSVALHGQGAVTHEAFSGIAGSFKAALRILRHARSVGVDTEVDTTFHAGNIGQLQRIADVVELLGGTSWNVSYLVPVEPRQRRLLPSPEAVASSLDRLLELARTRSFAIKTTAAPNYPRHVAGRSGGAGRKGGLERVDERGFAFVSHQGDIHPNGLLPVRCGNVRTDDLLDVYRHHMVFRLLRTPGMLGGKCRACGYRHVCAGSRARAYAVTRSLTAQDPLCAYVPPGFDAVEHRSVQ